MRRRRFLLAATAALAGPAAWAGQPPVRTLPDALRWIDTLERAARVHTSGAWPLSAVLDHLAQSIEMSMDGYPRPKPAWFQQTAGSAAFAFFKWRGRMSHGLDEPIPGAPALVAAADWRPAAARLRRAILRFDAHGAALRPHFAYGTLGKGDYALAHSMHIANHQDEVLLG